MKIKIASVQNQGNAAQESVTLEVLQDCDLKNYVLLDSTYNANNTLSNTFRHTKWFHPLQVKAGDKVIVSTKVGIDGVSVKTGQISAHYFFWNSNAPIWNNNGDTAVLLEIADWEVKKVL